MLKLQTPWKVLLTSFFFTAALWMPHTVLAASETPANGAADGTVRILVKVDPMTSDQVVISSLSTDAQSDTSLSDVGWRYVDIPAANVNATIQSLQLTAGIAEVTPDYPLELAWNPNDPNYVDGTQWALDKIGANVAWEFSTGQAITVAVVDSGVDPHHPDLAGRLVPGYNFVDDNSDTTDQCGHGTHVAGIIAADANNNVGVAGVANQAVIMPIKVIGASCTGSYSRLMQGILYAVDHGVRVISITSGGGFDHNGLHDAIKYASDHGVLVAVAAGNRASDQPFYPGSYPESFTVAGTDSNDAQYEMSNFGNQIDIAAPAVDIFSTFWNADQGSTYATMSGTSMAAPHVAAVAALVLSLDPKLPLTDLENTLTHTANDLGVKGWDPIFGWGRISAWRAVAVVSPVAGNIRSGHYRVPDMQDFPVSDVKITKGENSFDLSWNENPIDEGTTIVIYRSPVPVFDAASDVTELPATAEGSYEDTDIVAGQTYYYWFVKADNDVEVAITDKFDTTTATMPATPTQATPLALYMPLLQR